MAQAVICAENSMTRAGLAAMAATAAVEIVAQVDSVAALEVWLRSGTADLALVELPVLTAEPLLLAAEELSLLLLVDDWNAHGLLQLVSNGVSVLPVTASAEQLRGAIAALTLGLTVLHPDLAAALTPNPFEPVPVLLPLTPREVEVLNELAGGLSNRAIARNLTISEHTVKFHISAILSKLGVASRTEAVAIGIRAGLVML